MDRAKDVSPKVILSVSLYADLTRINYWARESERLRGTPATGSAQLHPISTVPAQTATELGWPRTAGSSKLSPPCET